MACFTQRLMLKPLLNQFKIIDAKKIVSKFAYIFIKVKHMSELQKFYLTNLTENQAKKMEADKLSESIKDELSDDWIISAIHQYDKFENSYKIEFEYTLIENNPASINHLAISLTDKIVSPWLLYFYDEDNRIELIYNKNTNSRNRKAEFDVIKWGHLQITK